ncbi:hypothetical protein KTR66_22095 [Roseococcus sp. SDR]|uniref:hypothetical protein n=1 Tax=Roseococcus sp. SDR TaxID=2835532 RepID=UPI001BCFDFF0|nr:hypothetical protein [Roseococcus sp. SDR]MBS7792698.1 hypothetical protein [Roseococcus sp. SDR]MBV1848012.1 hypothetical protein [Roseococcus sp. SDR]
MIEPQASCSLRFDLGCLFGPMASQRGIGVSMHGTEDKRNQPVAACQLKTHKSFLQAEDEAFDLVLLSLAERGSPFGR